MTNNTLSSKSEVMNNLSRGDTSQNSMIPLFIDKEGVFGDSTGKPTAVIGGTGSGKTLSVTYPSIQNAANKNEDMIITDCKGDIFRDFSREIQDHGYRLIVYNLRDPECSDSYNILDIIRKLYKTRPSKAEMLLNEFTNSIIVQGDIRNPYWVDTGRRVFYSTAHVLLDIDELLNEVFEEEMDAIPVSVPSIAKLLMESSSRSGTRRFKDITKKLPKEDMHAQVIFEEYLDLPSDTKKSVHSVLQSNLAPFYQVSSIRDLTSHNDYDFYEVFDSEQPVAVFIIFPEESDIFDRLAGNIADMILNILMDKAYLQGGALKRRCNFFLEEFGLLSRAFPNIVRLLASVRSRNIRMMLVLQSGYQVNTVTEPYLSNQILANCETVVLFNSKDYKHIASVLDLFGDKWIDGPIGSHALMPMVSANDISTLAEGECYVITGKCKFFSRLYPYQISRSNRADAGGRKKAHARFEYIDLDTIVDLLDPEKPDPYYKKSGHVLTPAEFLDSIEWESISDDDIPF